jgi:hypothetical protein
MQSFKTLCRYVQDRGTIAQPLLDSYALAGYHEHLQVAGGRLDFIMGNGFDLGSHSHLELVRRSVVSELPCLPSQLHPQAAANITHAQSTFGEQVALSQVWLMARTSH